MNTRSWLTSLAALCCVVLSVFAYTLIAGQTIELQKTLRLALVKKQITQQQSRRLGDEAGNPLLKLVGEDMSALQVRVAEFIRAHSGEGGNIKSYEQQLLSQPAFFDGFSRSSLNANNEVKILRLRLELEVSHAPSLLDWIERILGSTGGWPAEVRACDVHKIDPSGLVAICVVDVYHWQGGSDA